MVKLIRRAWTGLMCAIFGPVRVGLRRRERESMFVDPRRFR